MAAHDKLVLEAVEEYEYALYRYKVGSGLGTWADMHCSYESLPPNFSLAANMAAGAFAGIAVGQEAHHHADGS